MHVCYYNQKGILVTHPKHTACHYITRGFFGDFMGVVPMEYMLHLFVKINYEDVESISRFYKLQSFIRFNRILQMYRLPDAFSYFEREVLMNKSVFWWVVALCLIGP